jgi:hypothetical protein
MTTRHNFKGTGYIGGADSDWPGARRPVPACAGERCLAFRRDDGTLGSRAGPGIEVPAACTPGPDPTHLRSLDPTTAAAHPSHWTAVQWLEVMATVQALSPLELRFLEKDEPSKAEASGAVLPRLAALDYVDVSAFPRVLGGLVAAAAVLGAQEVQLDMPARAVNGGAGPDERTPIATAVSAAILTLVVAKGRALFGEWVTAWTEQYAADPIQLVTSTGGSMRASSWSWKYFEAVIGAHAAGARAQRDAAPPAVVDTLTGPTRLPTGAVPAQCDLRPLFAQMGTLSTAVNVHLRPPARLTAALSALHAGLTTDVEAHRTSQVLTASNLQATKELTAKQHANPEKKRQRDEVTRQPYDKGSDRRHDGAPSTPPQRPTPANGNAQPSHGPASNKGVAGQPPNRRAYTACTKCKKPTPNGRPVSSPLCFPCANA